jgi:type VI secretion system protein ImpC
MNYAESIEQQSPITAFTSDTFSAVLMKQFNPRTEQTQTAIDGAVRTLALQALENAVVISNDAYQTIQAIIAEIDRKLSQQINTIIHDEAFQQLESSWRGLHYLVNNTETDELLKIRCMPVTKTELRRVLKRYKGVAWDQSPIFKKVYEEEYGQFGGEPLGCLVGDYYFDHSPPDVETLGEIAKIAAAAHCPFITGASPAVMQSSRTASTPHGAISASRTIPAISG